MECERHANWASKSCHSTAAPSAGAHPSTHYFGMHTTPAITHRRMQADSVHVDAVADESLLACD